ncbi:MAG: hypothetical protein ACO3A2_07130 [Bdellovibrionia bacterium]
MIKEKNRGKNDSMETMTQKNGWSSKWLRSSTLPCRLGAFQGCKLGVLGLISLLQSVFIGGLNALAQDTPSPPLSPSPPGQIEKRDPRIPRFYDYKPQWGISLNYSPAAFGGRALAPQQGSLQATAFSIVTEFQPRFIQSLGVLGIGTALSIYPILGQPSEASPLNPSAFSIWSLGGQVRYQARFFRQQVLVPSVAYAWEYLTYYFNDGPEGHLLLSGPVYGLWLLLNWIDPSTAAHFFIDYGVARTYLIFEARDVRSSQENLNIQSVRGFSYFLGLRFEF